MSNIPALIQSAITGPGIYSVMVLKDVLLSGYSTIAYCKSVLSVKVSSLGCKNAFSETLAVMEDIGAQIKNIQIEKVIETLKSMKEGF